MAPNIVACRLGVLLRFWVLQSNASWTSSQGNILNRQRSQNGASGPRKLIFQVSTPCSHSTVTGSFVKSFGGISALFMARNRCRKK
ncbi:hypothetical protein B0H14DRAFT_2918978 [Mycena olivaceomarginata]|nr:hypothetical protein B0H14DRAFT_2918978 [Mycena olivaceomarginata]